MHEPLFESNILQEIPNLLQPTIRSEEFLLTAETELPATFSNDISVRQHSAEDSVDAAIRRVQL